MEFIHSIEEYITALVLQMPYFWIIIFMALESTVVPLPSEVVMPPAGILVAKGIINFWTTVLAGITGSIIGSIICYFLAQRGGMKLSMRLLGQKNHELCINYFEKNGDLTILIGRLLPGIRHIISFPAGLFKMDLKKFILYTALGAGIWVTFLTYLGMWFGKNMDLVYQYKWYFITGIIIFLGLLLGLKIGLKKWLK